MIKRFIWLEWKKFMRSSAFQGKLVFKILMLLGGLYFLAMALLLGVGAFFIIEELFPGKEPLKVVNNYIIFWFLMEMIYRYFLQNLPVVNIEPLMVQPIKRKSVIHYLIGKTAISFFNIVPLFFYAPFSAVLIYKGYDAVSVLLWFSAMFSIELLINNLNFMINKSEWVLGIVASALILMIGAEYLTIFKVSGIFGNVFYAFYSVKGMGMIAVFLMILSFWLIYRYIRKDFYLDGIVSKKVSEVKTAELSWLNRFGETATFLKNDLRLIWRNKRPKSVLFSAVFFLFYGIIFFTDTNQPLYMLVFASMFVTAGFLFTFGGYVPSWDSQYYKLLMSQNIPYRKYLEAKWYLMVLATLVSFVLCIPYLFFGWEILGMIAAGALFNIGINSFVTLYSGAINRTPIDLSSKTKSFSNSQNFSWGQLLLVIPKIVLPVGVFIIPYKIWGISAGLIALSAIGASGLIFKNFFLNLVENVYQRGKYKTIAAYNEK